MELGATECAEGIKLRRELLVGSLIVNGVPGCDR
jgi:hypothetical protein